MKYCYPIFFLLLLSNLLSAQNGSQHAPLTAIRLSESITIDGFLNEAIWKPEGCSSFTQSAPVEGAKPTQKTEFWVAYDNDAIYFGAYMHDSNPDSIVRILSRRDVFNSDDWAGVAIDSYHDKKTGYFFTVAASGTKADGTINNDENLDEKWDGIWEGKSQIVSDGWTLEMRIPFSQMRFQDAAEIVMGINFVRDIGRNKEEDFIVFTPRNQSGFASRFPDLLGIKGINTSRKIEVLPYVSSKAEYLKHKQNDPYNDGSLYSSEIGADFKMGLGSNLTLDATVNPDFGQVEVDPAVVNLTDVESFFEDKRPFFVEGSSIFDNFGYGGANNFYNYTFPQITQFYSRRIGRAPQGNLPSEKEFSQSPIGTRILGAGKLTGKIFEDVTIGTVHAFTNKEIGKFKYYNEKSELRDSSLAIEPYTYYGILRAQKDFNDGFFSLGFLSTVTARNFEGTNLENRLNKFSTFNGIDGYTFFDDDRIWILTGWAGFTHVQGTQKRVTRLQSNSTHYFQRPDAENISVDTNATSLTGYAGRFYINKQKGNVIVNSSVGFINPSFEINDVGYNPRTNVVNLQQVLGYKWNEPTDWYRKITLTLAGNTSFDYDGNNTWIGIRHSGSILFNNYYEFEYSGAVNPETKNITATRGGPIILNPFRYGFSFGAESDSRDKFVADFSYSYTNSKSDNGYYLEFGIDWKPSENISLRFSPGYSNSTDNSNFDEDSFNSISDITKIQTFGKRYIFSQLDYEELSASFRVNWTFTPELSLEVYIQPLLANGKYSNIKELQKANSYDFVKYGTNGSTINYYADSIVVDFDGSGVGERIKFGNPNFSTKSVIGNAVFRWEYLPGSTLFFVWTQSRKHDDTDNAFKFQEGVKDLILSQPENVFIIKLSYWLPI